VIGVERLGHQHILLDVEQKARSDVCRHSRIVHQPCGGPCVQARDVHAGARAIRADDLIQKTPAVRQELGPCVRDVESRVIEARQRRHRTTDPGHCEQAGHPLGKHDHVAGTPAAAGRRAANRCNGSRRTTRQVGCDQLTVAEERNLLTVR